MLSGQTLRNITGRGSWITNHLRAFMMRSDRKVICLFEDCVQVVPPVCTHVFQNQALNLMSRLHRNPDGNMVLGFYLFEAHSESCGHVGC